ncbi:hypothetical protein M3J09_008019 [Ascochyta lentis]
MAAADFAGAPTAEQDGSYTIHQTITCHYHVYAPTTVHTNSDRPRCATESSSEGPSQRSPPTSTSQPLGKADVLEIQAESKTTSQGKRQAILEWLIAKLAALLERVSH